MRYNEVISLDLVKLAAPSPCLLRMDFQGDREVRAVHTRLQS
jgi:hypothetical protein